MYKYIGLLCIFFIQHAAYYCGYYICYQPSLLLSGGNVGLCVSESKRCAFLTECTVVVVSPRHDEDDDD